MEERKIALVTGSARGIGAAITEKLLNSGFWVCATDCQSEELTQFSEELSSRFHSERILSCEMDVTRIRSIEKVAGEVHQKWGTISVLVNNAGIFFESSFLETNEDDFLQILNTNLLGILRTSQTFLPTMQKEKRGKIINIASIAALKGARNAGAYAASKAGVVALGRSMALEFALDNIQVNTLLPGYVETPLMGHYSDSMKKLATWRIPNQRLGFPYEVADVVVFLATAPSYLTGSEIVIDGGYLVN